MTQVVTVLLAVIAFLAVTIWCLYNPADTFRSRPSSYGWGGCGGDGPDRTAMSLPTRPTAWLVLIAAAGLLFGLPAGVATNAARGSSSAWAAGLAEGLLASTLVAAFWYALVTHRLLVAQRDSSEVTEHPWLHVSAWPITTILASEPPARPLPVLIAKLNIQNVGRSPALLQAVRVSQPQESDASSWVVVLQGDSNPRALAPGQEFLANIVEISIGEGERPVYVDVSIEYFTLHGGGGQMLLRLRYGREGWKSRETHYDCTLSSGTRLPGRPTGGGLLLD